MYCLVRGTPDQTPVNRVKDTLVQYGILPAHGATPTDEQLSLQKHFHKRVQAITGVYGSFSNTVLPLLLYSWI